MSLNIANLATSFSSRRRNFMLSSHRRDDFIEWLKSMLYHSFVLDAAHTYVDTMSFFEELVQEHRERPALSRLKNLVPTVGKFHTPLPLREAFELYDQKYSVSKRNHVGPTFNELRHTLNLAQVMAVARGLRMITFDGDQTLYSDGANFERDEELSRSIIALLQSNCIVAVVTAAGYGLDGPRYETRLQGLLDRFVELGLDEATVSNFYVCGGECNFLLRCQLVRQEPTEDAPTASTIAAKLFPVAYEDWQAEAVGGPRPYYWSPEKIAQVLDIAEAVMKEAIADLKLRANFLRKERACGIYPGGGTIQHTTVPYSTAQYSHSSRGSMVLPTQRYACIDNIIIFLFISHYTLLQMQCSSWYQQDTDRRN